MLSFLSDEYRQMRPDAIIGMIGSLVAIASFFLLPIGSAGFDGPLAPTNGWRLLLFLITPPFAPVALAGLLIVLLLPGCCFITLVIGGVGLYRRVPRHQVHLFTLALLPGLVLLGFSFFANFAVFQSLWGLWGMGAGYVGILVGRYALAQESA